MNIHNIRATHSYVAGSNGSSNGLVPMLRVFNDTARYVDQVTHTCTASLDVISLFYDHSLLRGLAPHTPSHIFVLQIYSVLSNFLLVPLARLLLRACLTGFW